MYRQREIGSQYSWSGKQKYKDVKQLYTGYQSKDRSKHVRTTIIFTIVIHVSFGGPESSQFNVTPTTRPSS